MGEEVIAPFRVALPRLAVGLLTLAFASLCAAFVNQPGLASFADDSVSYLVMAQVFSPWQAVSAAVAEAFAREATYPPLFPLLLAVAGAAHDIAFAHVVVALLLALCLPVAYLLGTAWLASRWAAAAAATVTALLPLTWIQAKGVLSEPLFCLLLLAVLCLIERNRGRSSTIVALSLLMAALVLTRTVGIVVLGAYGLWALTRRDRSLARRLHTALPALVAAAAYGAWVLARPVETSDDYLRIVREHLDALLGAGNPWAALGASLLRQAHSMAEAWIGALLLFWVEGHPVRVVLAAAVGALALSGMILRIAAGRADGWMTAAYLGTFLLWPFYDQMTRFLFPVVPVLVLYAFWAVSWGLRTLGRPAWAGHALLAFLLVSLAAPALAFIHQRATADGRYVEITDWYRTPDLLEARARAQVHLDLLDDMEAIGSLTRPQERVMWVTPSYIALLANRRGIPAPDPAKAPDEYRRAVQEAMADYLFLSQYHPRDTIRDAAWRAATSAMMGEAAIVHARIRTVDGQVTSLLLKLSSAERSR